MALHRGRLGRLALVDEGARHDLRAFGDDLRGFAGFKADELQPIRAAVVRERERAIADEAERFVAPHRPAQAHVVWRHGAVRVLAHDDETLLGPQHMHGLGAVGRDPERFAGRHQRLPNRQGVVARHVDFVTQFTAEADAEDLRRHAGDMACAHRHEREGVPRQVDVFANAPQHLPRFGPHQRGGGPVVGHGSEMDVKVRPLGLMPELEPRQHGLRVAGGGVHQVAVFGETRRHAVVEDGAVLAEHQAVAAAGQAKVGELAGVDAVEERGGVRAFDGNLAEGGSVQQRDAGARAQTLAAHRVMHRFAGRRVVPRPFPAPDVLPSGAAFKVPSVHRRQAFSIEAFAHVAAGDGAERHRRIGGAEHGHAGLGDALAEGPGQDGDAVHVAELALVGAETQRRVALDVFHGAVALAGGEFDVLGRHVQLQVHELPRGAAHGLRMGRDEERVGGLGGRLFDGRRLEARLAVAAAGQVGGAGPRRGAFGEACRQRKGAGDGAGGVGGLPRRPR